MNKLNMPPLPPGFELDETPGVVPPPPAGFELDTAPQAVPAPPAGFTLDTGAVEQPPAPALDPTSGRAEDIARNPMFSGAMSVMQSLLAGEHPAITPDNPNNQHGFVNDLPGQMLERGSQLAGGFLQSAGDALGGLAAQDTADTETLRWLFGDQVANDVQAAADQSLSDFNTGVDQTADQLRAADFAYEPRTTWQDVKNDPLHNVGPFIAEQGVNSVPDMAAMLANLPGYIAAQTGNLADERASNNGQDAPTGTDYLAAAPAAAASAALDRFSLGKILGLGEQVAHQTGKQTGKQIVKEAAKSSAREGLTEATQEGVEYTATNAGTDAGTDAGFDPWVLADRAAGAAVAGAGLGGLMDAAVSVVNNRRAAPPARAQADATRTDTMAPVAPMDTANIPAPPEGFTVDTVPSDPVQTEQAPVQTEQVTEQVQAPAPADVTTEPVQSETVTAPAPENNPRRAKVYTPDNEAIDVEYQVVEADSVKTSDQQGFDQSAQPRDRSAENKNSEGQIEGIANAPNFDRLYRAPETDRGAPVVGEDGLVESGNGRVMGLRRAYERGAAEDYRQRVTAEFPEAAGMKNPIIVARRLSNVDRTDFAYRSNIPATMQMSATELADAEARMIDDQVVSLYRGGEILSPGNTEMVRAFIGKLPKGQQNVLIRPDGGLSIDGQRRFEAALFQRAYGDRTLLARLTERTDDDMKSVTNALRAAAPTVARLRNAIDRGEVSPDADLTPHLQQALARLADIRARGVNLRTDRAQVEAFAEPLSPEANELLGMMYNPAGTRLVSQDAIRAMVEGLANAASEQKINQGNLPGVEPAPLKSAGDLIRGASENRDGNPDPADGPGLFGEAKQFTPAADSRSGNEGGDGTQRAAYGGGREANSRGTGRSEFRDVADTDRVPRGTLTSGFADVSKTDRRSIYEGAYREAGLTPDEEAGLTPDEGVNLPPAQRRNVLARLLQNTFGFAVNFGSGAATIDVVNSMLDGYQNLRMMLHTLSLPLKALSLNGTLTLSLDKEHRRYLGAFDPATNTIHMPGRSNSFAHEWMHALDAHLLNMMKPGTQSALLSQLTRSAGLDPLDSLEASFINLIHAMTFDQASLALKALELENRAAQTIQKGPKAGQPTQAAMEAQDQLDRLHAGATKIRNIKPTNFRQTSKDYGQATGGDGVANYFGSVHEMLARAFEAYVAHKIKAAGGTNEFVTKGDAAYLSDADARLRMTFPKDSERMQIFSAFDDMFDHLRRQAILGTGPAAANPGQKDIYDPQHWTKEAAKDKEEGATKAALEEFRKLRNMLKNLTQQNAKEMLLSGVANAALRMGISPDLGVTGNLAAVAGTARRMAKVYFGSLRGNVKFLVARNKGKGGEFLGLIADRFITDIGTGREIGQTFEEARERPTAVVANQISDALRMNGFGDTLTKADNDTVLDLLYGKTPANATAQHKAIAGVLRRIMEDGFLKARRAKLEMGYIENKGYVPRVILPSNVEADPASFVKQASKVYELVYDDITANISADDMIDIAAITGKAVDPLGYGSGNALYTPQIKALRAAVKRRRDNAANNKTGTYDPSADDAAIQSALDSLKAAVRDDYARVSAEDWKQRILIGDSFTYDSHGPASNFRKKRTLPPEADEILSDFYDRDTLSLTMNYASKVNSKAEYQTRVGNPAGTKRLRDVIARREVAAQIKADPDKYNPDTAQGRLNILRDLTDIGRDNILELAMTEAEAHGASPEDVKMFRGIIEDMTGGRTMGAFGSITQIASNLLYLYTYVRLLPRAAITSLTEPISIMMRTGDVKAATDTLLTYLGEVAALFAGQTDKIAERAAVAKAVGLITTPLFDHVLMNRMSGDFATGQNAGGTAVLMSHFFRANGLTQLTNIQRRVVMNGGYVWLHDMASRHLSNETSSAMRKIIEAELRDLGVPQEHMQAFVDWLAQKKEPPTLADLNTNAGQLYSQVIARFVDQTIQNPRRADKPIYAASPVGRVVYALTAYLYTFFRNVHMATVNRSMRNYEIFKGEGATTKEAIRDTAVSTVLPHFVVGFGLMFVGQALLTAAREMLFNAEQWEDKKKNGELGGWLFRTAMSRTGILGPADVINSSLTGLKYERDLTSLGTGAGPAVLLSDIQNMYKGWAMSDGNSPNTNTSERQAAKSLYNLAIAPAWNALLSGVNVGGPLGWGARYAAMVYGSSQSAASGFADMTAGEQYRLKKGDEGYTPSNQKP